ncbi:MAG: type II toxin-antitoxin system HicA family toxin [Oscillospiraceae bacterium]|nr:type II toxin-antitoxin system HicA family toxin [Oscillospiraceae bacterium]
MRTSELKRMLKKAGCRKVEEGKKHEKWYSPITGKYFRVDRHDGQQVDTGTLHSILKDAGLK